MVVFINGSLGVGKSSVANYLLWSRPKTVLLEGDALCNLNPFDTYDKNRIDTLTNIIVYMIAQYGKLGYQHFVVDSVFEKVEELKAINLALSGTASDITHYLLTRNNDRREENIRKRNRENFVWEIQRSRELQEILVNEFQGRDTVRMIDTSHMSVRDVGESILGDTKWFL